MMYESRMAPILIKKRLSCSENLERKGIDIELVRHKAGHRHRNGKAHSNWFAEFPVGQLAKMVVDLSMTSVRPFINCRSVVVTEISCITSLPAFPTLWARVSTQTIVAEHVRKRENRLGESRLQEQANRKR